MEQFDLETSTNTLLDEFELVSFKGTMSILEWFYKAANFSSIFEERRYSEKIYTRLIEKGYDEVQSPIEEKKCFKKLMERTEDDSEQRVGYYIISLIMKKLKENKVLPASLIQFISIYNETYNKKKTYETMMENLKETIGEDVVFIVCEYGSIKLLAGTLENVDPFHSVTISGETYAFIGSQRAIAKITDNNGKTIYNNARATDYDKISNSSIIEKKCEDLFGNNYKRVTVQM
ncbi:MAG: hypothetical protein J1F35_02320 [Erysipelotrichales bacterium]|nr:hypothetical protein [Erysipelotrichales bacterium]